MYYEGQSGGEGVQKEVFYCISLSVHKLRAYPVKNVTLNGFSWKFHVTPISRHNSTWFDGSLVQMQPKFHDDSMSFTQV